MRPLLYRNPFHEPPRSADGARGVAVTGLVADILVAVVCVVLSVTIVLGALYLFFSAAPPPRPL